jgi:hypothetical protein
MKDPKNTPLLLGIAVAMGIAIGTFFNFNKGRGLSFPEGRAIRKNRKSYSTTLIANT